MVALPLTPGAYTYCAAAVPPVEGRSGPGRVPVGAEGAAPGAPREAVRPRSGAGGEPGAGEVRARRVGGAPRRPQGRAAPRLRLPDGAPADRRGARQDAR